VHERERSLPDPLSAADLDSDPEWAEYSAWLDTEAAAGRDQAPYSADPGDEWYCDDAECCGDGQYSGCAQRGDDAWYPGAVADSGTALRAGALGIAPRVGRPGTAPRFGQGDEADVLPPGPLLVGLTDEAVRDFGALSDDELTGVILAARRQQVREEYKQVVAVAEFGRRRLAAFEDAKNRGVPVGWRPGGFPGEELAVELVTSRVAAAHRIENALDLTSRLPATLAGMAAGLIDEDRAAYIAYYTHSLAPADALHADEILAAGAPDLRADQLARKAAALEMKLAPEAARARKEHEKQTGQRVEARRESSGNASLSAREMDTADAIASKSYIDAIAARLRGGGLNAPLGVLRVLAMTDLTQGRNPLDRLGSAAASAATPAPPDLPPPAPPATPPDGPSDPPPAPDAPTDPDFTPNSESDEAEPGHALRRTDPAPLPALITLLVPAGTILGTSTAPAQAGAWGLLDHEETRAIVAAASRHPKTRWCVTLTNGKGEAIAHACSRGQHPRLLNDLGPQPPPARLAELLRRLNLTFEPIARGSCEHAHAEEHYTPSRTLRHLVRARTATCDAPGCDSQAVHGDLDHTVPHPEGPSCQCNLGPKCRTHHRCKQAPDWKVEQPEPGVIRWTVPSGRTHTTKPTRYDL
jgi:hypothetical protein